MSEDFSSLYKEYQRSPEYDLEILKECSIILNADKKGNGYNNEENFSSTPEAVEVDDATLEKELKKADLLLEQEGNTPPKMDLDDFDVDGMTPTIEQCHLELINQSALTRYLIENGISKGISNRGYNMIIKDYLMPYIRRLVEDSMILEDVLRPSSLNSSTASAAGSGGRSINKGVVEEVINKLY